MGIPCFMIVYFHLSLFENCLSIQVIINRMDNGGTPMNEPTKNTAKEGGFSYSALLA